jgi:catechol 2,3-dioxygenase-like lactoylglutathione lyase family enzyme
MLDIIRMNHINSVVADFQRANTFYERTFDAVKYMDSYDADADRDASLLLIGATPIELFSPRGEQSLLGQSLARYGEGFHSFEFQVPDLEAARAVFERAGVRFTTYREGSFFMTHPKDGHGVLFEVNVGDMVNDPRLVPGFTDQPWRDGPLGLVRLNALGVATADVSAAAEFYRSVTGAEQSYDEQRPGAGRAIGLWAGGLMLEFVEPGSDGGPVAEYLQRPGPNMRSLDFQVVDVDRTRRHFTDLGLRCRPGDVDGQFALDPEDNYGVLYQFSEAPLPHDPRDG